MGAREEQRVPPFGAGIAPPHGRRDPRPVEAASFVGVVVAVQPADPGDSSNCPLVDEPLHGERNRVVAQIVCGHGSHPVVLDSAHDTGRALEIRGERFLDQHVFAGSGGRLGKLGLAKRFGAQADRIDVVAGEQLVEVVVERHAISGSEPSAPCGVGIPRGDELDAGSFLSGEAELLGVDEPEAQLGHPQGSHARTPSSSTCGETAVAVCSAR